MAVLIIYWIQNHPWLIYQRGLFHAQPHSTLCQAAALSVHRNLSDPTLLHFPRVHKHQHSRLPLFRHVHARPPCPEGPARGVQPAVAVVMLTFSMNGRLSSGGILQNIPRHKSHRRPQTQSLMLMIAQRRQRQKPHEPLIVQRCSEE